MQAAFSKPAHMPSLKPGVSIARNGRSPKARRAMPSRSSPMSAAPGVFTMQSMPVSGALPKYSSASVSLRSLPYT